MTNRDEHGHQRFVASAMNQVQQPPSEEVRTFSALLLEFLRAHAESAVDIGGGMGSSDFWLRFGGKSIYINVRES
jgi:hypothetical protein